MRVAGSRYNGRIRSVKAAEWADHVTSNPPLDRLGILIEQDSLPQARHLLESLRPQLPPDTYLYYLAFISQREGDFQRAIETFGHAISIQPQRPILHWGLALALLTAGDLERGWREFEWRLKVPELSLSRNFSQPQWNGSQDLRSRTILLHAEGGFGDAIQFCRFVPMVAARGAKVLLECHQKMIALMERLPGVSAAFVRGQPLPPFDMHCPLQSLPLAFDVCLETIPNQVPYLHLPADRLEVWRKRLGPKSRFRVGLAWCGSGGNLYSRPRSLQVFAPLAQAAKVEFHSLQVGPEAYEKRPPGMDVINHCADLSNFTEAAALISQLDLVISVDTAAAHLAGALGTKTWMLLSKHSEMRWYLDRADSPWYPTLRLFRQPKDDPGWCGTVGAMAEVLRGMEATRTDASIT